MVTNPRKYSEKRPALRLTKPALHVALMCPLVRTKMREGELSITTFNKLRPWWVKAPALSDGLCHHCSYRRSLISQVHSFFEQTNPDLKCPHKDSSCNCEEEKKRNAGWHLHLWKKNPPKYPSTTRLLEKFDPLCEHSLRKPKNSAMAKKLAKHAEALEGLERHFRLALTIEKRNKLITDDFKAKGALGKDWVRLTHDAKNPLVIGLGGRDGAMTTEQKRRLGICACVGLLAEFADPDGGKKARKAVVANLSTNTDKTSYATLQHFFWSVKQSPIKEILEDPAHTRVEVICDNARNYISKEFLYGCTKTLHSMFPHLKEIRWAPLCPCHGKTNLDRFYTVFTSWITTYQYSNCISSIGIMKDVLNNGAKGAEIRRREMGEPSIPTSVNIFKLKKPPPTAPYVKVKNIQSMQCVTYITNPERRLNAHDSGFYINVLPWISWRRGWAIPQSDLMEKSKARVLTAKQLKLREEHKPPGEGKETFKMLVSQAKRRQNMLKQLDIDEKDAMKYYENL